MMEAGRNHDTDSGGLTSRQAALEVLDLVLKSRSTLKDALSRSDLFRSLTGPDRRLSRMILTTVLRRLGQIDDLIMRAEERPAMRAVTLQNILRIGAAQILFMDIPHHAAVDTTVNLAARAGLGRHKGFVNGMLRTLVRVGKTWKERQDEARLNTPDWLLKSWIAAYGLRTAAEIAVANLSEAPLDISVKEHGKHAHWRETLKATDVGVDTLRRLGGGAVSALPGFEEGHWWVQDASAALPVHVLGDIRSKTVIDLCAAPGGKTMQLAAKGARVISVDRSARRLTRLHDNLKRLGLSDSVKVITEDAAHWKPAQPADFVLLDAPCSATGTLRRNPDIAWLKTEFDVERLSDVQGRILNNAFSMLAPGGTLVYCTCSLQPAEGEEQIARFIAQHNEAYKVAITPDEIGGLEAAVTDEGDVRLLPFHQAALGGMDGFFISRLRKIDKAV